MTNSTPSTPSSSVLPDGGSGLRWNDGAFAIEVAARAQELGLTYRSSEGARPIAVALPVTPEADDDVADRARIARIVLSALVKVGQAHKTELLDGLSLFERDVLLRADAPAPRIVTARSDILVDVDDVARVLEVNTTIPAMQGYSDVALRAWAEVFVERSAGVSVAAARRIADDVLTAHGSNADDLLDALRSAYELDDGTAPRPAIALVHRAGDSQWGELSWLASRFRARGHEAKTVVVDDLRLDPDGRLTDGSFVADVCYRHVFARLVPEGSAFAHALSDPARFHVYNPITGHLEQKAALALLSQAADDDDHAARLGLTNDERDVVARHVPWTRVLTASVVDEVIGAPSRFVLKRSCDFGGKSVVLGTQPSPPWPELVARAVVDGHWVVQERVTLRAHPHLVAVDGVVAERSLYTDASAYSSFGVDGAATGGVRRASTSPIVNIQSGGGVMPLITTALLRRLEDAVAGVRVPCAPTPAGSPRALS